MCESHFPSPLFPSADAEWLGLVNAMSGLLCTHLSSIDPTSTYQPLYSFKPQGAIIGTQQGLTRLHRISPWKDREIILMSRNSHSYTYSAKFCAYRRCVLVTSFPGCFCCPQHGVELGGAWEQGQFLLSYKSFLSPRKPIFFLAPVCCSSSGDCLHRKLHSLDKAAPMWSQCTCSFPSVDLCLPSLS